MGRSPLFAQLSRTLRIAALCERERLTPEQGIARAAEFDDLRRRAAPGPNRRQFLKAVGAGAVTAATLPLAARIARAASVSTARVAIVGGGMAGLACADRLARAGVVATVYEAHASRLGGRVWSVRSFPGQVAENGGELIDNLHKTMLGYANELNLLREDYGKQPGEPAYWFAGRRRSEADVIAEWRALVPRARADLQAVSGAPTALDHTDADVLLDRTDLQTWLDTRGAGLPLIQGVLAQAYIAEYGREPRDQSCLNLLLFIHFDRSAKLRPYGVFSDERYHLIGGNDGVVNGIRARLPRAPVLGARLTRLARRASGEFELTFDGASQPERADAVVLAIPFSVLRDVDLDASLGLPAVKLNAIRELGYGWNAKTMIGFTGRPWRAQGGDGSIYADLPNLQNTWETNAARAGTTSVLTDYAGGDRGRALQIPAPGGCGSCHGSGANFLPADGPVLQQQVDDFLRDLDRVVPGARAAATRNAAGEFVVRRGHWLPQRTSRGSYTCYLPGQFTTVAGHEGTSVGALHFAGEHTDSFYEWQGFMEGAARSGHAAAAAILGDIKAGRL